MEVGSGAILIVSGMLRDNGIRSAELVREQIMD